MNGKREIVKTSGACSFLKAMGISYLVTFLLLALLAFLLYRFQIERQSTDLMIAGIYAISSACAGVLGTKQVKSRKFLFGALMGGAYFFVLLFCSLIIHKGFDSSFAKIFGTFFVCSVSGMAGGMLRAT